MKLSTLLVESGKVKCSSYQLTSFYGIHIILFVIILGILHGVNEI